MGSRNRVGEDVGEDRENEQQRSSEVAQINSTTEVSFSEITSSPSRNPISDGEDVLRDQAEDASSSEDFHLSLTCAPKFKYLPSRWDLGPCLQEAHVSVSVV